MRRVRRTSDAPGDLKSPGVASGRRKRGPEQGERQAGLHPCPGLGSWFPASKGLRLPGNEIFFQQPPGHPKRPIPGGQAGLVGECRRPAVDFSLTFPIEMKVGTDSALGYDEVMFGSTKEVLMRTVKIEEWTYEEFMSLPEGDPYRYELIDGEFFMTPSPNSRHQEISGNLFAMIWTHLRSNPLGKVFAAPCDVVFSQKPPQVVVPDLVFVSKARASLVTEKNIQGAPDLVVEILSEGTATRDRRQKRSLYERFGVPEYWIVDPQTETVQVFRLSDGRYSAGLEFQKGDTLDSPLLPGLSIPLAEVFPS